MGKNVYQFVAEPFVNKLGQTINPGDRVGYVTHSHRVNLGKGWFDGVFKDSEGRVTLTRVRGIRDTKMVETGEVETVTYKAYDWKTTSYVDRSYEHKKLVKVSCEPYGYSILQCHRMFKIEG